MLIGDILEAQAVSSSSAAAMEPEAGGQRSAGCVSPGAPAARCRGRGAGTAAPLALGAEGPRSSSRLTPSSASAPAAGLWLQSFLWVCSQGRPGLGWSWARAARGRAHNGLLTPVTGSRAQRRGGRPGRSALSGHEPPARPLHSSSCIPASAAAMGRTAWPGPGCAAPEAGANVTLLLERSTAP